MDPQAGPLDGALRRHSGAREHGDWLSQATADPDTRYLIMRGTRHLVWDANPQGLALLDRSAIADLAIADDNAILLGWFHDRRCVLLTLPEPAPFSPAGGSFQELRPLAAALHPEDMALLVYARALAQWRLRHRFCAVCASPLRVINAGHALVCTGPECGAQVFPRMDPAIIVLVTDGPWALLGRQASWPARHFSTLAGFVEAGETIEAALRREVWEESGALVTAVEYFASQPWPFPASLMLGFHAQGTRGPLQVGAELEDAHWFHCSEIRRVVAGQAADPPAVLGTLPPPFTISRRLIDAWLAKCPET